MSSIIAGITKDLKAVPENLKAKAKGADAKKLLLLNVPYILAGYFCDKVAWLWRVSEGADASAKMIAAMNGFDTLFSNPLPSFHPRDLLIGAGCGIALRLVVYYKAKNAKKFRHGKEYGSARWGNAKDIEPYMDSVFENNVLLTQTERLMMSGRPKQPKYARNKNILVIGGSGSGKTRFFVKPNLMQMHSSYVVTDPKGTVLVECGKMLKRGKYKIKVLNTINFAKSMHYNPFAYLRSEKDILKLVNTIIVNTKGEGQQSGEDFWIKAEKLYYTFDITMAIFDVGNHIVTKAAGVITGNASIDVTATLQTMFNTQLSTMGIGELIGLGIETMIVSLCMKIMSVLITVILYGRMIEIYLYVSVAPVPFATLSNREWGSIGSNYIKGLCALAFQGFFSMVCVGIYSVLVSGVAVAGNLHSALWSVAAYTVILCFSLFKTGSLSKSIFNAH